MSGRKARKEPNQVTHFWAWFGRGERGERRGEESFVEWTISFRIIRDPEKWVNEDRPRQQKPTKTVSDSPFICYVL
jgi:hypothetical protein